jgi:hypothetical protein
LGEISPRDSWANQEKDCPLDRYILLDMTSLAIVLATGPDRHEDRLRTTNLSDPLEVLAADLISLRLSHDRQSLRLRLRDRTGQIVDLSLPGNWLNTMRNAMPVQVESGTVHPLDSWSMDRAGNGQDLVLTLRTPEGVAVSFTTKPWQVEGMATIATYGNARQSAMKTVH